MTSAIRFDAASDRLLRTANLPSYDANYTVLMWVRFASYSGASTYNSLWSLNRDSPTDSVDALVLRGQSASASRFGVNAQAAGPTGYAETFVTDRSIDTWYCVAMVRSASNLRTLYVGNLTTALASDGTLTQNYSGRSAPTRMEVGGIASSNQAPLSPSAARIHGVKIWTRALTLNELINAQYVDQPVWFDNLHIWSPTFPGSLRTLDYSANRYDWTAGGTLTDEDGPPISWGAGPILVNVGSGTTPVELDATLDLTLDMSAGLTVAKPLSATSDLTLDMSAALTVEKPLSATSDLTLDMSAALTVEKPLSATSDLTLDMSADLTVAKPLSATSDLTLDMSAALTVEKSLSATNDLTLDMSAGLTVEKSLSATASISFGMSADLTVGSSVALSATSDLTLDMSADLTVEKSLSATSDLTLDMSADLTVEKPLSATTDLTLDMSAGLTVAKPLSATASISFGMSADLTVGSTFVPDTERMYVVEAEERTYMVPAEDRFVDVQAEDRYFRP